MSTNHAVNIATFIEEVEQIRKDFLKLAVNFYKDAAAFNSDDYIQLNTLVTSQTEYYFLTLSTNTDILNLFNTIAKKYKMTEVAPSQFLLMKKFCSKY